MGIAGVVAPSVGSVEYGSSYGKESRSSSRVIVHKAFHMIGVWEGIMMREDRIY